MVLVDASCPHQPKDAETEHRRMSLSKMISTKIKSNFAFCK
jgi:hypothetical protein